MLYEGTAATPEIGANIALLAVTEGEEYIDLFYRVVVYRHLMFPPPIERLTLHFEVLYVSGYKKLFVSPYQGGGGSMYIAKSVDDENTWYVHLRMKQG
jgi:hypothetical protein